MNQVIEGVRDELRVEDARETVAPEAAKTVGTSGSEHPLQLALCGQDLPKDRLLVPGRPARPSLAARVTHLQATSGWWGLPARFLGTMPLFAGHRVYHGKKTDWVLLNLADDPLFQDRQGFPIPRRVLEDLKRMEGKVHFDALFVAHEVQRGAVIEERPVPLEALQPAPPRVSAERSRGLGDLSQVLWALATTPFVLGAVGGSLIATVASVAGTASVFAMDPVLLGVVVPPDEAPREQSEAAWFYLSHWAYGA
ncbi:MAG: hypothetical protein U0821_21230 [Chloroflexota bacterium]